MKKSYIDSQDQINNKGFYSKNGSYISKNSEVPVTTVYALLPEEYSIFSEIDNSLFSLSDTEQHRLFSLCLQHIKKQLLEFYLQIGIVRVFPKLSVSFDDDGTITLNWAYANFRIYFNFENLPESSYYGVVGQNNEESIFTNTGKINSLNYTAVIDMLLKYVIENL